jgi:anaerobic C4-dicarboxylate transporter
VGSTVDDCGSHLNNGVSIISNVSLKKGNNNDDDENFENVMHHSKRDDKPIHSHHEGSTVVNTTVNSTAIGIEAVDIMCLIPQQDEKDQEVVADNSTDSTELAAMMMGSDGTTEVNLCPSSSSNNNSNSGEKRDESDETVESTQLPVGARELGESHPSSSQQVDV